MRGMTIAVLAVGLLAAPSGAWAQDLPPGNSGVGQYTENLPGPGGDKPSADPGEGGNLPPGVIEDFEAQGADGAAAAALAEATAPDDSGQQPASGKEAKGQLGSRDYEKGGGSPVADIFSALAGSGTTGMGLVLPILLAASLLAAVFLTATRLRRRLRRRGPTGEA